VPQPIKRSEPLPMWIWIVAAVVALLVLGGGGFALYKAMNPDKAKGTFAPAALTFDKQDVGTTSASKTIRLTNSGSADLRLKAASFSDGSKDFPLSNDHCSNQTIRASASCSVDIAFAPLTTGPLTTKLTFANSAGLALAVSLTGTAAYSRPGLYAGLWYPNGSGPHGESSIRITSTGGFIAVQTYCPNPPGSCFTNQGIAQFTTEPVIVLMSPATTSLSLKVDEAGNALTVFVINRDGSQSAPVAFHRLSLIKIKPSLGPLQTLNPIPTH